MNARAIRCISVSVVTIMIGNLGIVFRSDCLDELKAIHLGHVPVNEYNIGHTQRRESLKASLPLPASTTSYSRSRRISPITLRVARESSTINAFMFQASTSFDQISCKVHTGFSGIGSCIKEIGLDVMKSMNVECSTLARGAWLGRFVAGELAFSYQT